MDKKINTAIIGAGDAGKILARELHSPKNKRYKVICFFDDDVHKIGEKVEGLEVYGSIRTLTKVYKFLKLDLVIIALPSVDGKRIDEIVDILQSIGIDFMIVPPIFENLKINQISYPRKVDINDLIRRPTINVLDSQAMEVLSNSTIVITGVAGSIGSEVCKQLAGCSPKKIIGIDCAETPLFEINSTMEQTYSHIDFEPVLCDIKNITKLHDIFREHRPDIVYHCAAYKHVELMESFPKECVLNNVGGTLNVIDSALTFDTKRFIFVSTDKAVYPSCIMGASKRIMEKYILSLRSETTSFMIVRFANVLESNGSLVQIIKKQLHEGLPVTITDMRMERYFMTISEAAQLIIQSSILGKNNDLFVLDMGDPYKIIDIIHRLIKLHGFPVSSIPIKTIGIREGEKIKEELFYDFEKLTLSKHERIFVCKNGLELDKENYQNSVRLLLQYTNKIPDIEVKRRMYVLV